MFGDTTASRFVWPADGLARAVANAGPPGRTPSKRGGRGKHPGPPRGQRPPPRGTPFPRYTPPPPSRPPPTPGPAIPRPRLRVESLEDRSVPVVLPTGFAESVLAAGLTN